MVRALTADKALAQFSKALILGVMNLLYYVPWLDRLGVPAIPAKSPQRSAGVVRIKKGIDKTVEASDHENIM